ncbi:hypothetical protein F4859DRAFT_282112 [Xylaria cf. heliscus]|nr:hypothetical protein F4859DRAFT_282112 [Xylaria cf. heliscus]
MDTQIDGRMRIYYVRSVEFAKKRGRHSLANYLMQYGSCGDRDQILHDNPSNLAPDVHFRYEEEVDKWHIRVPLRWDRNLMYLNGGPSDSETSNNWRDESEEEGCNDNSMNENSTVLNVAEPEWEGPFTGFNEFDDNNVRALFDL